MASTRPPSIPRHTPRQVLRALFPARWRQRLVLAALGAVAAVVLGLSGPWSPLVLARVHDLARAGDSSAAVALCESAAAWNPVPNLRRKARFQAGILLALDLEAPRRAVRHFRWTARHTAHDHPLHTLSLELLAATLLEDLHHPARAARVYERLTRRFPHHVRLDDWRSAAAHAHEQARHPRRALFMHAQVAVSQGPRSAGAWIEMGRLQLLRARPARAYHCYQEALAHARTDLDRRLARIGKALSLEALGQVEAAVAELDEAGSSSDTAVHITRDRLLRRAETEFF